MKIVLRLNTYIVAAICVGDWGRLLLLVVQLLESWPCIKRGGEISGLIEGVQPFIELVLDAVVGGWGALTLPVFQQVLKPLLGMLIIAAFVTLLQSCLYLRIQVIASRDYLFLAMIGKNGLLVHRLLLHSMMIKSLFVRHFLTNCLLFFDTFWNSEIFFLFILMQSTTHTLVFALLGERCHVS